MNKNKLFAISAILLIILGFAMIYVGGLKNYKSNTTSNNNWRRFFYNCLGF
jgi:putative Mn2+ efflux pump MntP